MPKLLLSLSDVDSRGYAQDRNGGKPYEFPFSLNGEVAFFRLESPVDPITTVVSASLADNFYIGNNPWFDLSAGFDPDIHFLLDSGQTGELCCWQKTERNGFEKEPHLFRQVFGKSCLRLQYWADKDDYSQDERGNTVLEIQVTGNIPKGKAPLFDALSSFFQDEANGYFLKDHFHGNTEKEFDLVFRQGYSSYYDADTELDCIESLFSSKFKAHLYGVALHPNECFQTRPVLQRAQHVRRISSRSLRKIESHGTDTVSVFEEKRIPDIQTRSNNVLSTFLNKLHSRLLTIRRHLESQSFSVGKTGKTYEIAQLATKREVTQDKIARCNNLLSLLREFLLFPVFAFSPSRQEIIFHVPASAFRQTNHYRFLYNAILKFELSHFYWSGDQTSKYLLPQFKVPDSGKVGTGTDFWIRKYSMLYEYWCYFRIHQTLVSLGFSPTNDLGVDVMHRTLYVRDRDKLQITLYHDVNLDYAPTDGTMYPAPPGAMTPDFALVFECPIGITTKYGLVILDAKSDDRTKPRMINKRNAYLGSQLDSTTATVYPKPIIKQSWLILSGENEPEKSWIECPPTCLGDSEFHGMSEKNTTLLRKFTWDPNSCEFQFSSTAYGIGMGYLRTRIRCKDDKMETDHFKLFLEAQIKLMEQLLA